MIAPFRYIIFVPYDLVDKYKYKFARLFLCRQHEMVVGIYQIF